MRSSTRGVGLVAFGFLAATVVGHGPVPSAQAAVDRHPVIHLVADINEGPAGSGFGLQGDYDFTVLGEQVYFSANDGHRGHELWRADGDGAQLVADINPGSASSGDPGGPNYFTRAGDRLYFYAQDGAHGVEPWVVTGGVPTMVADINVGSRGSSGHRTMAALGSSVYFAASQNFADRRVFEDPGLTWVETELWRADGTSATRYEINPATLHLAPESGPGNPASSHPEFLFTFKDAVWFTARNEGVQPSDPPIPQLWRVDGAGAVKIADIAAHVKAPLGDHLYFDGVSGETRGLWRTAGSTPELVHPLPESAPYIDSFTEFDGRLYFVHGGELWRTDGSTTEEVADLDPTGDSHPAELTPLGDHLYFTADDGAHGRELWRTDGTSVQMVRDIRTGSAAAFQDPSTGWTAGFTELDGFLYFAAIDGVHGNEMWRTNGAATELVTDWRPGSVGSGPTGMTRLGDQIIFSADDGVRGREVHRLRLVDKAAEGPPGHPSCSDGVDNDEDGLVDAADPDCRSTTTPVPPDPAKAPSAPRQAAATGGDRSATVTWSAAPGAAATHFTVRSSPGGKSVTVPAGARRATVTGLSNGTAYTFTVSARNRTGTSAASAPTRAVTPAGKPGRVKKVKAKTLKKKRVRISWRAAGANGASVTKYVVKARKGASVRSRTVDGSATRLVRKLPKGKHRITVAAHNRTGSGKASKKVTVRVR